MVGNVGEQEGDEDHDTYLLISRIDSVRDVDTRSGGVWCVCVDKFL